MSQINSKSRDFVKDKCQIPNVGVKWKYIILDRFKFLKPYLYKKIINISKSL